MSGKEGVINSHNIYVAAHHEQQSGWDDLISRLAWYFTPYLDQIGSINLCASAQQIEQAAPSGPLDPRIIELLPALKEKIAPVSRDRLDRRLSEVDASHHLFLLAQDDLQKDYDHLIGRFQPHGRFYRIDPAVRMEGSFYLWAGINAFTNPKAMHEAHRERFAKMAAEIGHHDKAYVFGTGPSLSDFVEGHDFSDGLTIAANSMVRNHELLDRLRPQIIVAADPIFHAGCSSYAAAFREALEAAMDRTGAWFVCPMRDVRIYETYLPERHRKRIVGIPFDAKRSPPTDLAQQDFALKPYPNVLTLLLLPLASTFARSVHIAGCDGRPVSEDGSFWAHDRKAQFNDEMDNIKRIHRGFFAIDYNNYYFEHARELEGVLQELEDAGRSVVNESPSFLPPLDRRSRSGVGRSEGAVRPFAPRTLAILDPDAQGEWGHFLAYDRRLGQGASELDLEFCVLGRQDLPSECKPAEASTLLGVFSRHSWSIGNKWPRTSTEDLSAVSRELEWGLRQLEQDRPDEEILLFMYCGSVEMVDLLEHVLITHPRVRAVINLFWSYNFDISLPAYREHWRPLLRRILSRPGQVRIMHSTPQIAAEFRNLWDLEIPVLPHPSTTFSDAQARDLTKRSAEGLTEKRRARILFPGGARPEKGYMLAVEACALLSGSEDYDLRLRARLDGAESRMRSAVEALDPERVSLETEDLEQEDFVDWLRGADVIVIPYLPEAFSNRTSGMLVDAMLLGVPVVVIEGTWLADELGRSGAGIAVAPTSEALAKGIREVVAEYSRYAAATRVAAAEYLESSTWKSLVGEVLMTAGTDATLLSKATGAFCVLFGEGPAQTVEEAGGTLGAGKKEGHLIYTDPRQLVGLEIMKGGDPEAALARWRAQAETALTLWRSHRQQLSPMPRDAALKVDHLAARLPRTGQLLVEDSLPLVLAECCLREDMSSLRAFAELKAAGQQEDNAALVAPSTERAVAQFRDLRQRCQEHEKASRVVQSQLEQLRAVSEGYYQEAEELRGKLKETADRREEEHLERLRAEEEISKIHASRSWRLTEPLRGTRRIFGVRLPRLQSSSQSE